MIQMQRQRDLILVRQRLDDHDDVFQPAVTVSAGRSRQDHRRTILCSGFDHHLQGFQVVDVECRHRVPLLLRFLQHVFA
ncbi:hypothetical protein D3C75_1067860 [compost metagenome]